MNRDAIIALTWSDIPKFDGQDVGLFIVADGEDATDSSISASQLAVEIVSQEIKNFIFEPSDLTVPDMMTAAIQKAHLQIKAEVPPDTTTLTAVLLIGNQAYIAHVGDSRASYAYGKYFIQLTDDHRFLQNLIELGHYTWEQVEKGEVYIDNVLYRALGQDEALEVDVLTEWLEPGSYLLLASDGLSSGRRDYVRDMKILSILQHDAPQAACDNLIEFAQQNGSTDDISVSVIKMSQPTAGVVSLA